MKEFINFLIEERKDLLSFAAILFATFLFSWGMIGLKWYLFPYQDNCTSHIYECCGEKK